ncbi:MAG: TonB-dependent receptor domain-containing protein, partial [Chitinophagales bacterium]
SGTVAGTTLANNIMSAGTEPFSYKNDLINNNFIVTDNLTIDLKQNQLTIGGSYEYSLFDNSFLSGGTMYYRYNGLANFETNKLPTAFGVTYPLPIQNGNTYSKSSYSQLGFYIQDKFSVSKRLTLTGGIRFDFPLYNNSFLGTNTGIEAMTFKDLNGNPLKLSTNSFPASTLMVSPRIAFNWDANGDKTLQLRGGIGVFTGRVPMVWLGNMSNGIGQITTTYNPSAADITKYNIGFYTSLEDLKTKNPALYAAMPKNEKSVPGSIAVVDKDLKMPQVLRGDFAIDYKLPWYGLIATGEIIASRDIQNVMQYNANLQSPNATLNAIGDNRLRWTSSAVRFVNNTPSNLNAMVLTNTYQGYATTLTFGVQRQARKGLFGSIFLTRTWSEDVSSNPGSQATSAWNALPNTSSPNTSVLTTSQYNTPVRLMGSLSYKFEYNKKKLATTVSLYYEGANPGRYSYLYNGDMNGDGVNADLLYIPNSADEINWTTITNSSGVVQPGGSIKEQKDAWNAFVEQDEYLKENKGKYASRYGAQYPWYNRIDLRILQDFNFNIKEKKQTIQLSLDIINLPNLINSAWGVQKQLAIGGLSNNNAVLRTASTSGANAANPTYTLNYDVTNYKIFNYNQTFVNNNSPFSTWYMQLGARYIF